MRISVISSVFVTATLAVPVPQQKSDNGFGSVAINGKDLGEDLTKAGVFGAAFGLANKYTPGAAKEAPPALTGIYRKRPTKCISFQICSFPSFPSLE